MTSNALHWYVAYVRSCQEKRSAEALEKLGVEHYLPVQRVKKKYSDRTKLVDQLVLPRMLFIRTSESRRTKLLSEVYGLTRYMTSGGTYHPVIIPEKQMEDFRFMVDHGEGRVRMTSERFVPGDHVKVISGPFSGFVYELLYVGEKRCLAVSLGSIGTATIEISPSDIVPAGNEEQEEK